MDGTKIQWTDATWNPIRGCSRISQGCVNCYAEAVAARFSGPGLAYEGLAKMTSGGPRWTGKVKLFPELLDQPARWKRPRRIFVNSMSDLFHETLPGGAIASIISAMEAAPQHTFQCLTKRAHRMRSILSNGYRISPHVWWGVSVEDQAAADDRIPALLDTPAEVRWLSLEPLIGPVKIPLAWMKQLDWIVIGGESGPGARPFHLEWAEALVQLARKAGTKVFMKQLGARPVFDGEPLKLRDSKKGGDIVEFPPALQVREYPEAKP